MELAPESIVPSVSAITCPFFQYLATPTTPPDPIGPPVRSYPVTYISLPTTAMEVVQATFVPSVSGIACPFFQYLATSPGPPLYSRPATYTSLPTTTMEDA